MDLGEVDGRPKLPDDIPAAVFDRYLAGRRACGNPDDADAFTVSYPAVASTPDLNGDGQRDWVIEAPSFCAEQAAADYGYEVWISDETDGASRAFVAAPGRWPAFQVDRTPAGMLDARPCLTGEICETAPPRMEPRRPRIQAGLIGELVVPPLTPVKHDYSRPRRSRSRSVE